MNFKYFTKMRPPLGSLFLLLKSIACISCWFQHSEFIDKNRETTLMMKGYLVNFTKIQV